MTDDQKNNLFGNPGFNRMLDRLEPAERQTLTELANGRDENGDFGDQSNYSLFRKGLIKGRDHYEWEVCVSTEWILTGWGERIALMATN